MHPARPAHQLTGLVTALALLATLIPLAPAQPQTPTPATIELKAAEALQKMSQFLGKTPAFSFDVYDMADEIQPSGQKIQLSTSRSIVVQRPDKIAAKIDGDLYQDRIWYDGRMLAMLDKKENVYAQIEVPDTIDEMLKHVSQTYDLTMPLSDLLSRDMYANVMPNVRSGLYAGLHHVRADLCHHLAFRSEGVDWQIWIQQGDKPLPRKLVITYKELPGHPQFVAFFDNWNLSPRVSDQLFAFKPPAGAEKIELEKSLEERSERRPQSSSR
jgi:hypothetical protein